MKKIILYLFIFILMFQFLSISTIAADREDSVNISEQTRLDMQDHPDDIVVKLYGGMFMHLFAQEADISEMLDQRTMYDECASYMVIPATSESVKYKRYHKGEVTRIEFFSTPAEWDKMYPYVEDPSKVLGESTTVTNIYCLDGDPSHDGVYIYYVTDKGDYVLYKEYLVADDMYLFPVEEFYAFAKVVHEERVSSSRGPNGEYLYGDGKSIEDIFDVGPYKVVDYSWLMWVSVPLLVSCIAMFVLVRKRKISPSSNLSKT